MAELTVPDDEGETTRDSAVSAVRSLLRPPRREFALLLFGGVLVTVVICWYFGTDVWHALMIGAGLGALGLIWVALPAHETAPELKDVAAGEQGARQDVLKLSWSLRPRYGRVRGPAVRRVQDLGRYRLALHQLDLLDPNDRPEIERLIGSAAYAVLRADERRPPLLRAVVHCLDAIDGLDPSRAGGPAAAVSRSRPRTLDRPITGLLRRTHHAR